MNQVIMMGRLVRNPEIRYSQDGMAIARYTLAVNRKLQKGNEEAADFIRIVAFDKRAEFASKYFFQGQRVLISGSLRTGSYTNKEGQKVYTTEVWALTQEFADSKKNGESGSGQIIGDGFMHIPDGVDDEGLPFN